MNSILNALDWCVTWVQNNPVLFTLVVWPLITAVITWFTKPRSDEELALMTPRRAAFWRLVRKAGFDSKGVLDALKTILTNKPPSDPPKPGTLLKLVPPAVLLLSLTGCGVALTEQDKTDLIRFSDKLAQCREEGRDAGSYAAYEKCKVREGLDK